MGPEGFNVKMEVIPERVTLWHLHSMCLRSSMKRPQALSSPSESWLQRDSPWLMRTVQQRTGSVPCSESLPELLSTDHIIIIFQRLPILDLCSLPCQPYEEGLPALFVNQKYLSKTKAQEFLFNMSAWYKTHPHNFFTNSSAFR